MPKSLDNFNDIEDIFDVSTSENKVELFKKILDELLDDIRGRGLPIEGDIGSQIESMLFIIGRIERTSEVLSIASSVREVLTSLLESDGYTPEEINYIDIILEFVNEFHIADEYEGE